MMQLHFNTCKYGWAVTGCTHVKKKKLNTITNNSLKADNRYIWQ